MRRKRAVKRQTEARIGKVVTGLVVGSVVGATVGLLIAPASGKETRRRIKGGVTGVQSRTEKMTGNIEETGREMIGETRDEIDRVRDNIAERVTRRKKSIPS